MNTAITYQQLQENLDATCNEVCRNHASIIVKRQGGNVVLVAQEDYLSLLETNYLLKSPANAERLLASLNNRNNDSCFNSVDDIKAQLNLI
ncbi:antitoxin of the YoeB-YefM toxin-antitoxin system (modular protein) [Crenothrix polyspora]|jgi:antitoxin YefM|uniref:Antitoxin n=1 Tax=Crenothrix polyspora TaxID=360316 RepID=A0A1R4HFS3_9GAMM|nr:type II toxin-antitoxin system Phd/YefM family antitoxin [Crenothrix polyspora]SJM94710.1 antitoxin of the YoeB-YefM toxin-antitoxin system (modular protein) [Crenothrix polyspora]